MSAIGDIIQSLSTTTPLSGTGTFVSLPFVISEYNALSIIMNCDLDTTVKLGWSADGINFYYVQTFTFLGTIPDQSVAAVASKWLQVTISLTNGGTSSYMSFETYGTPGSNAVSALLRGFTSKTLPAIDVTNSFSYTATGEILDESLIPDQQYIFNNVQGYGTSATGFHSAYNDITLYTANIIDGGNNLIPVNGTNSALQILEYGGLTGTIYGTGMTGNGVGTTIITSNQYSKWLPGFGLTCEFSASYNEIFSYEPGATYTDKMMIGMGTLNTFSIPLTINEGIFLGYTGTTQDSSIISNAVFGIFIYRLNNLYQFIPQANWNIDKCNGDGGSPGRTMPNITTWKYMNTFRIQLLPQGDIVVSILNPTTGIFNNVHRVQCANNPDFYSISFNTPRPTFQNSGFQMIDYFSSNNNIVGYAPPGTLATGGVAGTYLASWMTGFENTKPDYKIDRYNVGMYLVSGTSTGTGYANSTNNSAVIYGMQNNKIFGAVGTSTYNNYYTVYIDNIEFAIVKSSNSVGTGFVINVYINPTYIVPGSVINPIDIYNSGVLVMGTLGGTWTSSNAGPGPMPYQPRNSTKLGTDVPVYSKFIEISVGTTVGSVQLATSCDLRGLNIKLYPNDYLYIVCATTPTNSSGAQNLINGNNSFYTSVGFHQLH